MQAKLKQVFTGVFLILLLFGSTAVHAQKDFFLVVTGSLKADDGNNEGVQILISKNNVEEQTFTPPKNGKFRFEFAYNNEFQMTFFKDGYYKKIIVVSTHVPKEVLDVDSDFPPFTIQVSLVKEIPGLDKSFANKPAGRIFYDGNIDNFSSETFFSDIQLEEQAAIARSKEQALSAEERNILALREKDYEKLIADADVLFRGQKYDEALAKFQSARSLFPERPYPNDRIAELQDLVNAMKIADQRRQEIELEYQQKIAQADDFLKQQQYDRARMAYLDALSAKAGDAYATAQIAKVDQLINQQQIDLQYNNLITEAEQSYNSANLTRARELYQQALLLKPGESNFINEKLRKIDSDLAAQIELAQKEKQYQEAMEQGNQAMQRKNYNDALLAFKNALTFKPSDGLASQKVAEAENILLQLKNRENYDQRIASADEAVKDNDLTKAKSLYQEALSFLPDQAYPKEQIAAIDKTFALNQQFDQLVVQATQAAGQQEFGRAKQLLEQALQLKDEQAAREQLEQINRQLAKLELENNYTDLLKKADAAKSNAQFEIARSLYSQALELKDEKYPADQIRLIDEELAKLAALEKLEQQFNETLANAEALFNRGDYAGALKGFNAALALKTDNQLVKGRIQATEEIIIQQNNKKKFDEILASATQAFDRKEWLQAKELYQQALAVLPQEQLPKDQIKLIDQRILEEEVARKREEARLAALALEQRTRFDLIVKKGDALFEQENFDGAKEAFNEALSLLPQEAYPKQRLADIEGHIAKMVRLNAAYNKAIDAANKLAQQEQYLPAREKYEEALQYLPNEAYPKNQIARIDEILAQIEAERLLEENYKSAIQSGDSLFVLKSYEPARAKFESAVALKPGERYPRQKIADIDAILTEQQKVRIAAEVMRKAYDEAIRRADGEFAEKQYTSARFTYKEALAIFPDENYPKEQIAKIDLLLEQEKEAAFKAAIASGDQLFQAENYSESKSKYNDALKIKPEDAYAKSQIAKITALLEKLAQDRLQREKLDKEYAERLKNADLAFNNSQFEQARSLYEQAATIKPEETYPPAQIAKIDSLLQEMKKREEASQLYAQAVRNAQNAFDADRLQDALKYFREAATLKPDEALPKKRIPEIEALIAQREELARLASEEEKQKQAIEKAKKDSYDTALANAQAAFDSKKYAVAKNYLVEALNIFPNEQFPKDRIAQIDLLIEQEAMALRDRQQQALQDSIMRAKQLAFDRKMQQAEQLENLEQFEDAILNYVEAKAILPNRTTEVEARINAVRAKMKAKEELEKNYAAAIKEADGFFNLKNWEKSRNAYQQALLYKPNEPHPQERIRLINQTLGDMESRYADAIKQADGFFNLQDWAQAKEKYNDALVIKPNEKYPKDQLALINQKFTDQLATAKIDQDYRDAIALGDKEFNVKSYDPAKMYYQKALTIKPTEQYPKDQLALIEKLKSELAAMLAATKEPERPVSIPVAKPVDDGYQQLIVSADNSFNQYDYPVARFYYQKANLTRPQEAYPKQRLAEIDEMLNQTMSKKELTDYEDAIKLADKAFADKQYTIAKFYYYKALGIKSWEQYPKDQILEIQRLTNSLLSALKEKEYQDLIAKADEAFVRKDYAVARAYYNRSLSVKAEEYPKIKLDEITKAVKMELEGAGNKVYLEMIAEGDKAMTANNYSIARFYYLKAIGINPREIYPKNQLKLISESLKAKE